MLRRCLFSSRTHLGDAAIENLDILRVSRRNNAALGLSGFLLKHGPRFHGALEGAPAALSEVMARIGADRRHCDLVLLSDLRVETRRFDGWSMEIAPAQGEEDAGAPSAETLLPRLEAAARGQARKAPAVEAG